MAPQNAVLERPRQMAASSVVAGEYEPLIQLQKVRIEGYGLVSSMPLELDIDDSEPALRTMTFRDLLEGVVGMSPAEPGFNPHGQKSYRGIKTADFVREALHLTGEMHGLCGYGLRILMGGTKPVQPNERVRDYLGDGTLDLTVDYSYN